MSTYDAKQDEEKIDKISTSLLPNLSHVNTDTNSNEKDQNSSASNTKDHKSKAFINLNIDQKFVKQLLIQEQIYFASIAPLKEDHIDVHCHEMKDVQLHYCCGLYMPISKSFTAYSLLSTEFMTSLKKLSLSSPSDNNDNNNSDNNNSNSNNDNSNSNNDNDNNNNNNRQDDESKTEDNTNKTHSVLQRQISAYKPEDYIKFHNLNKRVIVYVPGQQHASNEFTAAESIMNECLHFCVDFPYIVIPFIWPSEGSLLSNDSCILAEEYCANELNEFIRRLWALFEWIDVIGHGRGCGILLRAMQILMREKPEIIKDTHVVCIASDMESNEFRKYVQSLCNNVRRITLYTNTWDWKLFGSKWLNWTHGRAGASILCEKGLDTIDTTELLAGWFGSNHYYLTNEYVKKDIIQALSEHGGLDPKYRNHVLPITRNSSSSSTTSESTTSESTTSPSTYYILTNVTHNKPVYQDGDSNQPASHDNKQDEHQQVLINNDSNTVVNQNTAEDLQKNDIKGYVQVLDDENATM